MQALSLYESGEVDDALAAADRYRARYQTGDFLARTERVAARVLQKKGDLGAAQRRLQRAAAMAKQRGGAEAASLDVVEQADLAYQQGDYATADKLFGEISARPGPVGARACLDLPGGNGFVALRAVRSRLEIAAATSMAKQDRGARFVGAVGVRPVRHRVDHGVQIHAFRRQAVFVSQRSLAIGRAIEHTGLDEGVEALLQDGARDAQPLLEGVEAAHAQKRIREDQQRPAVTHYRQKARHRARLLREFFPLHALSAPRV